jgi:maltose O-acetyltransferase
MLSRANAHMSLRGATTVGARAHTMGSPFVKCRGRLDIGDDFVFSSHRSSSHIVVARGGHVVIGNAVTIESGAAIACEASIHVGDRVRIGRDVMILDTDFHEASSMGSRGSAAPIRIGNDVHIGARVVVLKGASIGDGARVADESVVSGVVPANAFVSGNPARVRRASSDGEIDSRVAAVVRETLGARDAIGATWDSLGALRLLLALEEEFAVALAHDALHGVASTDALTAVIERSLADRSPTRATARESTRARRSSP